MTTLERLRGFFGQRLWTAPPERMGPGHRLLYGVARVGYATVQGFLANRLTIRAAALTYYAALSLVPFLAFAFAVLKGLGVYSSFVAGTLRPYLAHTFGANPALLSSLERVLVFVDRTNLSGLGALGLATLVYTSVSLIGSVEDALNVIWGARTRRSFLRQVTDYVTLLVTAPLLVVTATTAASAPQSSGVLHFLRQLSGLGTAIEFLLRFTSLATVGLAFFAVYVILPNVRIRPLSAALGALVAALLWQAALVAYVRFQVGVSSYNALYSVLSALPIFLVWTYASWLVLLTGAQVGAAHQDQRLLSQRLRSTHVDQSLREALGVVAAAYVVRDFLDGGRRRDADALAGELDAPELALREVLEALVRGGVLARTASQGAPGYVPARAVERLRVSDVRDALRRDPEADPLRAAVLGRLRPPLQELLGAAEEAARGGDRDLTLRELAELVEPAGRPAPAPLPAAPAGARRPVEDAK